MAQYIKLYFPILAIFMMFILIGECLAVSQHDNAVMQLAKSIKNIEKLLRESNNHLKKISSSPHLHEPTERSEIDPTLIRPSRPLVHSIGSRSAAGIKTLAQLEKDVKFKLTDNNDKTTIAPPSRIRRPPQPPPSPSQSQSVGGTRRDTGDDVLDAINTMIKRRFNTQQNVNSNININKNDNNFVDDDDDVDDDIVEFDNSRM